MITINPIGGDVRVANAARSWDRREGLQVVLERGGRVGRGEASPLDAAELPALEKELRAVSPTVTLDELDDMEASSAARFAVETALLDLRAQERQTSVAALLAGDKARSVLGSTLLGDPREARTFGNRFRCAKLKVGPGSAWKSQAAAINALQTREPAIALRLDFNGTLTASEASDVLADIEGRRWLIDYVEDPTEPAGIATLETQIDVAVDALLATPGGVDTALELAASGHAKVAVIKPALHGGLRRSFAIASTLAPALDVVVSHLLDGPVALAACAELACAVAGLSDHPRPAGVGPHAALAAYEAMTIWQIEPPWLHPRVGGLVT